MELIVYKSSGEHAKKFAEYMNDMEWHTRRELLDELGIPIKKLESWLRKDGIEETYGLEEVMYIKHGKSYTSTYRTKKYRVKEKIKIVVLNKNRAKSKEKTSYSVTNLNKWKSILSEKIGDKKKIKKNDLVDIGIAINFNENVKKLIMVTEELGVRVV